LLSYGGADQNIKIEISLRRLMPNLKKHYELKKCLGISILVTKKDYLFASKFAALTSRRILAIFYYIWSRLKIISLLFDSQN